MPCEGPVYLRHATADDAAGIAQVHVDGWQKAYKDLVPEQYLGCTNSRLREEFWRGELEVESPDRTPWVALIDDRVIGFAAGGITRDDDADPHTGEIYQLFVAPECWSQGIRSNLIKRVSRDLAEHGFDNAIFWILANDEVMRSFAEYVSWVTDGTTRMEDCGDTQVEQILYRRKLR